MIFLKLEYAGQNEIDGLNPKIFWVIFFQPLLLDSKHGGKPSIYAADSILQTVTQV